MLRRERQPNGVRSESNLIFDSAACCMTLEPYFDCQFVPPATYNFLLIE
jgi:hypothetical protein